MPTKKFIRLRLVFTSDGVGGGIVGGVVKSAYDLVTIKNGSDVVNGVLSSTEPESERNQNVSIRAVRPGFHFLPTPLMTPSLRCRSRCRYHAL